MLLPAPFNPEIHRPHDTAVQSTLRREAQDDKLFTYRTSEGNWIVAYPVGEGKILDLAFLGDGDPPVLREGTKQTVISALRALRGDRGPIAVLQKKLKEKESAERRKNEDRQREYEDHKRYIRRHSNMLSDHVMVQPGGR